MYHNDGPSLNGLKDIFIMKDSGECVFHQKMSKTDDVEADQTVMSSLLSAIEIFSVNIDNGGAQMFETQNYRFIYHRNNSWIYVARANKDVSPTYITKAFSNVSEKVKNILPTNWDGNVQIFQGVGGLLEQEFNNSYSGIFYEISNNPPKGSGRIENKIYSFLRFKGRASSEEIAKLMRVPEEEVNEVINKMIENRNLMAYHT